MLDGCDIGIHATICLTDQRGQLAGGLNGGHSAAALSGGFQNTRNIAQCYVVMDADSIKGLNDVA